MTNMGVKSLILGNRLTLLNDSLIFPKIKDLTPYNIKDLTPYNIST